MKRHFLIIGSMIVLAGCNAQSRPQDAKRYALGEGKAQTLLEADRGSMQENGKPLDPVEAHLWARKQVDRNDNSDRRRYTTVRNALDYDNEEHVRVLQLKRGTLKEQELQNVQAQEVVITNVPTPPHKPGYAQEKKVSLKSPVPVVPQQKPIPVQQEKEQVAIKPQFKPVRGLNADPPEAVRVYKDERTAGMRAPQSGNSGQYGHMIKAVRIGKHPGKTRIVFDADAPLEFSASVRGRELVIDFDGADWETASQKSFPGDSVLSSYNARNTSGGAQVLMNLKQGAKVISKQILPPNSTYNSHRIVVDISTL